MSHNSLTHDQAFFSGALAPLHYLTEEDIQQAWQIFWQFSDKDWSFTDCTSRVVMARLGLVDAFVFDRHFRQFGFVKVAP
ncbi:MAG: type II toxin-antitoxin system VapC family toxin [Coleofasciculaceae cyanobacterium SM2_3_26]|nr:type II toxin-antitoxin system VapC family toxin [Coleofasciculaceae cyanobacterium SM2_3_26]